MITGKILRDMIISGANNIYNNKDAVNRLNVFPVPDGDTGTNMSMTVMAAVKEIVNTNKTTATEIADITSSALLRGARGNSGVITSLLFRGAAKHIKGKAEVDGKDLAAAVTAGVAMAYKAIMKPTEGTMLTVARVAAEKAVEYAETESDPIKVLEVMLTAAEETLEQTPEMLPVLKQAGVVDAGGRGIIVILEGMLLALRDGIVVEAVDSDDPMAENENVFEKFDTEDIKFAYCTEYLIVKKGEVKDGDVIAYRAYIESIGDSVVIVDDDEIVKTHVHTNNPDKALKAALELGELIKIKIENMKEQHTNMSEQSAPSAAEKKEEPKAPEKKYGIVSIAAGDGISNVFRDLGCDCVVEGGQTMNPCTEDILEAAESVSAEIIYVFPNNKNIIMAAEMAIPLCSKKLIVIPTKTIPQGVTCLLSFDPDADEETNTATMTEMMATVKSGQVTYAVRDSVFDDHTINEGQTIGILETKVSVIDDDRTKAAEKLFDMMYFEDAAFVNIYYGNGITQQEADELSALIDEKTGGKLEINVLEGGQPVYYYILSVE